MDIKMGRRKFINILGIIFLSPFIYLFYKLFKYEEEDYLLRNSVEITLPQNNGFHHLGDYFVIVSDDKYEVFLNKCTHLGCRLMEKNEKELICPCHGSKFDKKGKVISGPAEKNLESLKFIVDKQKGKLRVFVG